MVVKKYLPLLLLFAAIPHAAASDAGPAATEDSLDALLRDELALTMSIVVDVECLADGTTLCTVSESVLAYADKKKQRYLETIHVESVDPKDLGPAEGTGPALVDPQDRIAQLLASVTLSDAPDGACDQEDRHGSEYGHVMGYLAAPRTGDRVGDASEAMPLLVPVLDVDDLCDVDEGDVVDDAAKKFEVAPLPQPVSEGLQSRIDRAPDNAQEQADDAVCIQDLSVPFLYPVTDLVKGLEGTVEQKVHDLWTVTDPFFLAEVEQAVNEHALETDPCHDPDGFVTPGYEDFLSDLAGHV